MAFGDSVPIEGDSISVGGNEVTGEILLYFGKVDGCDVVTLKPEVALDIATEIVRKLVQGIESDGSPPTKQTNSD